MKCTLYLLGGSGAGGDAGDTWPAKEKREGDPASRHPMSRDRARLLATDLRPNFKGRDRAAASSTSYAAGVVYITQTTTVCRCGCT